MIILERLYVFMDFENIYKIVNILKEMELYLGYEFYLFFFVKIFGVVFGISLIIIFGFICLFLYNKR